MPPPPTNPSSAFQLQELAAPAGWTALLLRQSLPVDDEVERLAYREAVGRLMDRLPPFAEVRPEELFLLFERCRPEVEVKVLQAHARGWLPQFGMGVWLHGEPPETWTREEFEAAEPGTLRPVVERVIRVQRDPGAQLSAWRMLLGSGALLRVSSRAVEVFVDGSTDWLQPTIPDLSLTSFPFYVPLLRGETLLTPSAAYDLSLDDQLPGAEAYVRESVEDGGLLMLVHLQPEILWKNLPHAALDMDVVRITLPPS